MDFSLTKEQLELQQWAQEKFSEKSLCMVKKRKFFGHFAMRRNRE